MELLTEHRPVNGPLVYGFLHLVKTTAGRATALTAALTDYCRLHELLLGAVFTERVAPDETPPGEPARSAAFTALLDVLALPGVYGVVLPAASHLGPRAVAAARHIQLAEAGTRVLLLRPPNRSRASADRGAGHAIRRRSPT